MMVMMVVVMMVMVIFVMMMVVMVIIVLMVVMVVMVVNELHVGVPAALTIRRGSGCVCYPQNSGSVWNRIEQLAV